jgi:hypothetical protein
VTGTRIARPNFDTASPIVVLPAAAFERTGSEHRRANPQIDIRISCRATRHVQQYRQLDLTSYSCGGEPQPARARREPHSATQHPRRGPTAGASQRQWRDGTVNVIPPALIESVDIVHWRRVGCLRVAPSR